MLLTYLSQSVQYLGVSLIMFQEPMQKFMRLSVKAHEITLIGYVHIMGLIQVNVMKAPPVR